MKESTRTFVDDIIGFIVLAAIVAMLTIGYSLLFQHMLKIPDHDFLAFIWFHCTGSYAFPPIAMAVVWWLSVVGICLLIICSYMIYVYGARKWKIMLAGYGLGLLIISNSLMYFFWLK